ncbi:MAG: LamG-like jellyroll fold domain-containing protein, partial [bacterium]
MGSSKKLKVAVIGLLCVLLVGCGVRGSRYTIADLEAEYNRAQDAISHAENLNAQEHAPKILEIAQERLEKIRDKQLAVPSADIIRQYRYVQTLANRAALNSLNAQINTVQDSMRDSSGGVGDTATIQKQLTSLQNQLSGNKESLQSLTQRTRRQLARIRSLEDTAARIDNFEQELDQLANALGGTPSTRLGGTIARLVRRHNDILGSVCGSIRSLKQQLEGSRNRIHKEIRGRHTGLVYPRNATGLVGYWPLETIKDGEYQDITGNLPPGRTVGTVKSVPGIFGSRGISFEDQGSLLGVADHPDLDPGSKSGFALSGWFNSPALSDTTYLMNKWDNRNQKGWKLMLSPGGIAYRAQGEDTISVSDNSNYVDGKWHHVAVVHGNTTPGTEGASKVSLYVDGELKQEVIADGGIESDQFLSMGGSVLHPTKFFRGRLDEVMVYNQSLTSRKVKILAGKPPVPASKDCDYQEIEEDPKPDKQPGLPK